MGDCGFAFLVGGIVGMVCTFLFLAILPDPDNWGDK